MTADGSGIRKGGFTWNAPTCNQFNRQINKEIVTDSSKRAHKYVF